MADMTYRPLGSSGLMVSTVGIGCNALSRRVDLDGTRAIVRGGARRRGHAVRHRRHLRHRAGRQRGDARRGAGRGPAGRHRGDEVRHGHARRQRPGLGRARVPPLHPPGRRGEPAPAAAPTTSTCTSCTAPTPSPRSRRPSPRCTSWSSRARCATSAAPTSPGGRWSTRTGRPRRAARAVRQRPEQVLPARPRHRGRAGAGLRARRVGMLPFFPLAFGLLTGKYRRGQEAPEGTRLAQESSRLDERRLGPDRGGRGVRRPARAVDAAGGHRRARRAAGRGVGDRRGDPRRSRSWPTPRPDCGRRRLGTSPSSTRSPARSDRRPSCPVHVVAARPAGRFRLRRGRVLSLLPHHGAVAQLVAHLVRIEGVRGSSPLSSTPGQRPFPGNGGGPLTLVQQVATLTAVPATPGLQTGRAHAGSTP